MLLLRVHVFQAKLIDHVNSLIVLAVENCQPVLLPCIFFKTLPLSLAPFLETNTCMVSNQLIILKINN